VRWRADANAITHATLSDNQGDALDRLPESVFSFVRGDCELAGESERFAPAWVLADRPARDRTHWFYVDKATGLIRHELTREGARAHRIDFDGFEALAGAVRPRHWHVSDGDRARDLDVVVDEVVTEPVTAVEVAIPQTRRVFAAANPPAGGVIRLPASFVGRTIFVDAEIMGRHRAFILDTGTASITLDRGLAERLGLGPVLEHATVPQVTIGALALTNVSTLTIPLNLGRRDVAGILGYDFFFGHVVHIDYEHERVEVLAPEAAQRAFAGPNVFVTGAYYDEGLPLVEAAFGSASGDRFALDTGSPNLIVLAPFLQQHAKEIAAHWTPSTFGRRGDTRGEYYLEGSVLVSARRAAAFTLGPLRITDLTVGVEEPNSRSDAIEIQLDGIIGTDEMVFFDWWFDYDNGRIAMRRNGLR
jgi:hypothetical protein